MKPDYVLGSADRKQVARFDALEKAASFPCLVLALSWMSGFDDQPEILVVGANPAQPG